MALSTENWLQIEPFFFFLWFVLADVPEARLKEFVIIPESLSFFLPVNLFFFFFFVFINLSVKNCLAWLSSPTLALFLRSD